jgi:hypothetical protein
MNNTVEQNRQQLQNMNEIDLEQALEQANRIKYIKQLNSAQIDEERHKVKSQKIDNALVELSNEVALRISDYINGEPYNHNYEFYNAYIHISAIQNYLNSVFKAKFIVQAAPSIHDVYIRLGNQY